ncbi:tripartite tricarboxylate transporter substrate binding protein [Cupriavidus taiwanensis]|uniref:tripartite tricarboxylate transporter substrate binding protein n=1 Tax=Cupriavidus taiwanensis TaxID=164546 RepID=UPI000E12EC6F|nr:tripartite tricarboxylate transporter substrate binding protein [Cupriavidus taiwanensis]SPC23883.1 putative exported protein [Cupriavidus taiwanensis]
MAGCRSTVTTFLAGLTLVAVPLAALAAPYPDKPIRLIVTFVPGGGADIVGRYIADKLSRSLGQPVIVENRPGAGGQIGVNAGRASASDGHTLTLISSSYTVNPGLYSLKYDPVADVTPIVQVSKGPLILVSHADFAPRNVAEIIALARAKPGALTFASSGAGSVIHLAGERFGANAMVELRHIPYKGGGAALNDVISKQVDLYFAASASALPLINAGKLKAYAVTSSERLPALPAVPTISESGLPGYDVTLWYGIVGPKGMPADIVKRVNGEVNRILAQPETATKFATDGAAPAGGTPQQFAALIAREVKAWSTIVTKLGIKPD